MARPAKSKRSRLTSARLNKNRSKRAASNRQGAKATAMEERFKPNAKVVLLNKPYGYLSQFTGEGNTLADLVSIPSVYPAGRLDKDSEGLLILTDCGALQHRISHPHMKWRKHYWVQVEGTVTPSALSQLEQGVKLKDGMAHAITARAITEPALWPRTPPIRVRASVPDCWIEVVLTEGRNRQIRRMTAAVGLPTLRLVRHRIGGWDISSIQSGKYQTLELTLPEIHQLFAES